MEICMILRMDCDPSDRSVGRFVEMFSERPLIERVTGVGVSHLMITKCFQFYYCQWSWFNGILFWNKWTRQHWIKMNRLFLIIILSRPTPLVFLQGSLVVRRVFSTIVGNFIAILCSPVGWRLQPVHGPRAFGSHPPMFSRHCNFEP